MNSTFLGDLIGAGEGLLVAFLVATQLRKRPCHGWLLGFVISCGLLCGVGAVNQSVDLVSYPDTANLGNGLYLAMGPFLYLYVRSLTGRPLRWRWAWIHFLPFLLFSMIEVWWHLALSHDQKAEILKAALQVPGPDPSMLVFAAQLLIYLGVSLNHVVRRSRDLKGLASNLDRISFLWLRRLILVVMVLYLAWVPNILLNNHMADVASAYVFPLGIYLLSWAALRTPEVFQPVNSGESPWQAAGPPAASFIQEFMVAEDSGEKYQKSRLPDGLLEHYEQRLMATMAAQKCFLDPELNLALLAEAVGISPHHLSQVLNERMGIRFCEYVNDLRIKEAQRLLLDPGSSHFTVLDLAMNAGFSTKATFNSAFKQRTGQTPTMWRREQSQAIVA